MTRLVFGLMVGLFIGFALGWWFRPPSSFPLEDLKRAIEKKFVTATDVAREQLADFADDLAYRLRKHKTTPHEPQPSAQEAPVRP